jgi:hypothetical protein
VGKLIFKTHTEIYLLSGIVGIIFIKACLIVRLNQSPLVVEDLRNSREKLTTNFNPLVARPDIDVRLWTLTR